MISVVDFKGVGFLQLMQDDSLDAMGVGMVYEDTKQAEDNLASRVKSGSMERKEDIGRDFS